MDKVEGDFVIYNHDNFYTDYEKSKRAKFFVAFTEITQKRLGQKIKKKETTINK